MAHRTVSKFPRPTNAKDAKRREMAPLKSKEQILDNLVDDVREVSQFFRRVVTMYRAIDSVATVPKLSFKFTPDRVVSVDEAEHMLRWVWENAGEKERKGVLAALCLAGKKTTGVQFSS